jgi:hypothetical protein
VLPGPWVLAGFVCQRRTRAGAGRSSHHQRRIVPTVLIVGRLWDEAPSSSTRVSPSQQGVNRYRQGVFLEGIGFASIIAPLVCWMKIGFATGFGVPNGLFNRVSADTM